MTGQIISLATGIANPSEKELPLLEMLCHAAEKLWMDALKGGVLPEDCGEAFLCAAAFTASSDITMPKSSDALSSSCVFSMDELNSGVSSWPDLPKRSFARAARSVESAMPWNP